MGVILDGPQGANFWGIPTEVQDVNSVARHRQFRLNRDATIPQIERYYSTYGRRLGANKHFTAGSSTPSLRFGIWAPNAKNMEVVFGNSASGYIADDSSGVNQAQPVITLNQLTDGIWEGRPQGDFEMFKSQPYMYSILNGQGQHVYRTDIFPAARSAEAISTLPRLLSRGQLKLWTEP